jgi:hypothetical protein
LHKITSVVVLGAAFMAGAAACGDGSHAAPGTKSGAARRLPVMMSASQLRQRDAVKVTECTTDGAENLELSATVTNILPARAGFELRFSIYDANGVLLDGPGAAFTSPGIASIPPGQTGEFSNVSALNGSHTVTPVTCVLEGAVVKRPAHVRESSAPG